MNIQRWAERQIGTVEQDGRATARIRLLCVNDSSCLEVWEAPLPAADKWVEEANTLIAELREEWPQKPIQLLFISEDANGHQRSQCPRTVTGTNSEAAIDLHKGRDIQAVSQALEANVRTMDRILASANAQLDRTTEAFKALSASHAETLKFLSAKLENEALEAADKVNVQSEVMGLVKEHGPALLRLAEALAKKQITPAVPVPLTKAINGAASVAQTITPIES